MDPDPEGAEEFGQPLALRMSHFPVVTDTVLGLKIGPFFGELALEEVIPTDSLLLLKETFVSWWVLSGVK
jgi:hypothetical protein